MHMQHTHATHIFFIAVNTSHTEYKTHQARQFFQPIRFGRFQNALFYVLFPEGKVPLKF